MGKKNIYPTEEEYLKFKIEQHIKEKKETERMARDFFGENLKFIRKDKGMTQKEVADKLFIAVSTYANWEQGRRDPSIEDIVNLTGVFEIDFNELFNYDFKRMVEEEMGKRKKSKKK